MIETTLKEETINGVQVWKTYAKVESLKPNPQNPRDISKNKLQDLKDFLSKYPTLKPLIVDIRPDHEGEVIGGNMRLRAYKELDIKEVWVELRDPITDAQAFEIGTIDNMSFGSYLEDELTKLLQQYEGDLDLSKLDIHLASSELNLQKLLDSLQEAKEDEPPAVDNESEPISKVGEIYQLGRHKLYCGDSTKIEEVEKLMGGLKADMVFTDPPYNIDEGKTKKRLKIENDKKEDGDFYSFLLDSFTNLNVVSKKGATIYICHADSERVNFTNAMKDAGWLQKQCIIWDKGSMVLGRQDYHREHEPILYGWKDGATHYFIEDRTQTTVWRIPRPTKSEDHPTMKPIALMARAMKNNSKEGDIILDLFGGSGSTLIAAEQLDRIAYLAELDPKYADVIRKRYWKLTHDNIEDGWQEGTPAINNAQQTTQDNQNNPVPEDR